MPLLLDQHDKAVLQFSGGKDSLACLYLLKDYWDKITVIWVNTGAAYPEVIEQMASIKAMVPHFIEARSNAIEFVIDNGAPSDVVPVANTTFSQQACSEDRFAIQSWVNCCAYNLWEPLEKATKETGATLVIRGTRSDDHMKAPVKSGDTVNGFQYYLPLEDWTETDVFSYLYHESIPTPDYYSFSGHLA